MNELAVELIGRAIGIEGGVALYHVNLGSALFRLHRFAESAAACEAAIGLRPDLVEAYYNLGNALLHLSRPVEAVAAYKAASCLRPDLAEAYANRGNALFAGDRVDAAIADLAVAIRLRPGDAVAHGNLGNALRDRGRADEAVAACHIALCLEPAFTEAWCNLGSALQDLGQLDAALGALSAALHLHPAYAEAHFNRSLVRLLREDLPGAWEEYEWRWRLAGAQQEAQRFGRPRWEGENLAGRTILLHAEQGAGDAFQFCRYAPMVAARGGRVVLAAPRPLLRVLAGLEGVERLIAEDDPLPDIDLHCPLMSLPGLFGTNLATIPAATPYLRAEDAQRRRWESPLAADGALRIGLVWAGRADHRNDRNRSVPFAALAPLWRLAGIRWYGLQVGERQADLAAAPSGVIEDLSPFLTDFAETAACLSHLDLLLTVDTGVAHLAGGLGCPAWIMLPFAPDWRWFLRREDSPWYPTARLFRQTEPGDWTAVVARISETLRRSPSAIACLPRYSPPPPCPAPTRAPRLS